MPDPVSLLIATGNRHKVLEIDSILRRVVPEFTFELLWGRDFPEAIEPEETGETFTENALIKARAYARATGRLALADDSGLVVDVIEGRPGLYSARYAETPALRIKRVLEELKGIERGGRSARFVCVAALADPAGNAITREGRLEGSIALEPAGSGGFGYDPIFVPAPGDGRSDRTLAEIPPEEKDLISHRARAIEALADALRASLPSGAVQPDSEF